MKKTVSLQQAKHIAKVNQLTISKKEQKRVTRRLATALAQVRILSSLRRKTAKVEPITHISGLKNVFRQDQIGACFSQQEALSNTKSHYQGFVKTKLILK